ncbi:MAG: type II/IV secretion system ATPase subunit [Candidatus Altiarchaeota archaeon]
MDDKNPASGAKDQKKALLELINSSGRIKISQASEEMGLDKNILINLAEELARDHAIRVESHYITEPELEALNYKETKKEEATSEKSIQMETPPVPMARAVPKDTPEAKKQEVMDDYILTSDEVHFNVKITDVGDFVPHYLITIPHIDFVTRALLDETKRYLISDVKVETADVFDTAKFLKIKSKFTSRAKDKLRNVLKKSSDEYVATLSKLLVNEMLGLGDLEYLLLDDKLEEVVVNSSRDVVWVYHKNRGWLKTNIILPTEDLILNYSSRVAREVGREITHLNPLLDAHLTTGDRINATLSPISTAGNTITIRRFSRVPWSVINMLDPQVKTVSSEVAAFLWMAIEYELSVLIAGGTASGKTSMLNSITPFMPANQRILSIEDTRELNLPDYLQWVPMTTRQPNPKGEGGITMLDLLQNALRMRPDRIIVGEVRAKRESEVLFEAMHTGHSVYSTFHAERAQEVVDRITSPPMSIPGTVMKSLHLIVIQYRNRRTGKRRTFEVCELMKDESEMPTLNTLYKWEPRTDTLGKMYPSIRVKEELALFTGMNEKEIEEDIQDKKQVLDWMLASGVYEVNSVGRVVTEYYMNKEKITGMAKKKAQMIKFNP